MNLIYAEQAYAKTEEVIEKQIEKLRAEAEHYIEAHVCPAINERIAEGSYLVRISGEFAGLDYQTKQMICKILNDYHYETDLQKATSELKITWHYKNEEEIK